jgi:hypothetical protein
MEPRAKWSKILNPNYSHKVDDFMALWLSVVLTASS